MRWNDIYKDQASLALELQPSAMFKGSLYQSKTR